MASFVRVRIREPLVIGDVPYPVTAIEDPLVQRGLHAPNVRISRVATFRDGSTRRMQTFARAASPGRWWDASIAES